MLIDYTAKRSIKTGHTVNTVYQIDVDIAANDRSTKMTGKQHKTLNGTTVTVVYDEEIYLSISTELISAATTPDIDDMREFLDSVKGGESFTLDSVAYVLASIASPYTETRQGVNYFRYAFKVRQL